jgi:hypothetical protein
MFEKQPVVIRLHANPHPGRIATAYPWHSLAGHETRTVEKKPVGNEGIVL